MSKFLIKFLLFVFLIQLSFADDSFKNFEVPVPGKLPFFKTEDLSPTWQQAKHIEIKEHQLESHLKPNFGSQDMQGKVSVINFFFATCKGYCPRMTSNIKKAYLPVKDEKNVNFISYSVTPNIDTQEILKEFADRYKINHSNWHLVRGKRKVIYDLAREQLQADLEIDPNKNTDQFVHSESVYLVDQNLKLRGIYNSASARAMNELSADIKKLLKDTDE